MSKRPVRKILYTTSMVSPQSGAFRILVDMFRGSRSRGQQALLALPYCCDGEYPLLSPSEQEYVRFIQLSSPKRSQSIWKHLQLLLDNIKAVANLVRLIHREDISIVHVNEIFDLYAGVAARIAGVKCVWNVRADLSAWPLLNFLLPRLVSVLADKVVVASQSVRKHMFEGIGIRQEKISVLYDPGFDLAQFTPDIDGTHIREELSIADGCSVVTLIAKLSERKGHELLIQAAPHVLSRFPNTYFLVVGGELDGSHHRAYAARVRSLVSRLGLEQHFAFLGYRSDIPAIIAASDIIAHCSTYPDPFPGVVLQGMAMAKAVVAPNLGGPREQLETDVSGILFQPYDSHSLARAICNLLSNDQKRAEIGHVAAERVRSTFGFDTYFSNLYTLHATLDNSQQ